MKRSYVLSERLAYAVYDALGCVAALVCAPAVPVLLWRGDRLGLRERLGWTALPSCGARPVWIHAASVGETLAASPLVGELRRRDPQCPIVTSATTATGRAVARRELRPDATTLLPLDILHIADRVLRKVRPRCLVVVETEIWPGLFRAADCAGIPVVMVSGRISARSWRRYRGAQPLFRAALDRVSRFGMQTREDAERLRALGAAPDRVVVTGSLKASRAGCGIPRSEINGLEGRALFIGASTQTGEEKFLLEACAGLWGSGARPLLLIAPRRPERFDEVESVVARSGLSYQCRSRLDAGVDGDTCVLILDTIGELNRCFPLARAVFVGGTVAPQGGHNVLEPAVHGRPVAFGPYTSNVAAATRDLCRRGGGAVVRTPGDLGRLWGRFLRNEGEARAAGERARAVAGEGAGALAKTIEILEPFLG